MRPMLAATVEDINDLRFPILVSPKLDGIRGIIKDGTLLSRSLKPIPNHSVSAYLSRPEFEGLDGELVVGSPTASDVYRVTNSAVMTRDGSPDFTFYVFDVVSDEYAMQRQVAAAERCRVHPGRVSWLPQKIARSVEELMQFETEVLAAGYEGVIARDPRGRYKFGRSTLKEGLLLKVKRFKDSEAEILGMEELLHNDNEATTSELGYTKRSSHQDNKRGAGTMGALIVRDIHTGQEFNIGTGFTAAQRQELWEGRVEHISGESIVKYKYFDVGVKDLPRHPVFLGLRDKIDF